MRQRWWRPMTSRASNESLTLAVDEARCSMQSSRSNPKLRGVLADQSVVIADASELRTERSPIAARSLGRISLLRFQRERTPTL